MADRKDRLCALVADDLTGACDAAVQFAICGMSATVALDWSLIAECPTEVIAATTDSRADNPSDAAKKVAHLGSLLRGGMAFKKIDSVLRGNLGAEIRAALSAFQCDMCVIAPSFPSQGRQIVGGRLKIAGGENAATVHLPSLLADQGIVSLVHVEQARSTEGAGGSFAKIEDERKRGTRYFSFDASSDDDLDAVISSALRVSRKVLWVGSAGLAGRLAKRSAKESATSPRHEKTRVKVTDSRSAILLAIGSDHPSTNEQIFDLTSRSRVLTLGTRDFGRAAESLRLGQTTLLRAELGKIGIPEIRGFFAGLDIPQIRGLVLSGGDTASLVCSALGVEAIRLEGEIVPGIPWGTITGGMAHGLSVVTKSGGFGDSNALTAAVDFLGGFED